VKRVKFSQGISYSTRNFYSHSRCLEYNIEYLDLPTLLTIDNKNPDKRSKFIIGLILNFVYDYERKVIVPLKPGPDDVVVDLGFSDPSISLRIGSSYPWEIKDWVNLNVSSFVDFTFNLHPVYVHNNNEYIPRNLIKFGVTIGAECFL
jgi:hypothetical protein